MAKVNIARLRLYNQHLARPRFEQPGEVVKWLGAVQAQDYLASLWAVGLRLPKAVEADIEEAVAAKTMIRTWPMRGTLHFVAPQDVRWMLALLTPRIIAGQAHNQYRHLGLDEAIFTRAKKIFIAALQGGRQLPRAAMYEALEAKQIATRDGRGLHILSRLSQDGHLCFAARAAKQPTFALLDEWVPPAKPLRRDEALAELARRFFTSHGPATLQDFAWWSGLTTADARAGLEMCKSQLLQEVIDEQTYWLSPATKDLKDPSPQAHLLPVYDEYTVAYKDRRAALDPVHAQQTGNGLSPVMVINGRIVGTWKRQQKKDTVEVALSPFAKLNKADTVALASAVERYKGFLSKK